MPFWIAFPILWVCAAVPAALFIARFIHVGMGPDAETVLETWDAIHKRDAA